MNAVTLLFLVVGAALTALLYVFAIRRLLGLRLPFLRTLIAGVIAFLAATGGIIGVLMLGVQGGLHLTSNVTCLHQCAQVTGKHCTLKYRTNIIDNRQSTTHASERR